MEENKSCQEPLAEETDLGPTSQVEEAPVTEASVEEVPAEEAPVEEASVEETPVEETPAEVTPVEEAPVEEKSAPKPSGVKIAVAVLCVVLVLALVASLVVAGAKKSDAPDGQDSLTEATQETVVATVPADGNPDDVTCKGTYTVTDEAVKAAADTVVATIGDAQLTNGQLQVYYWSLVNSFLNSQTGYMMMAYGMLDYTQPLDTQMCIYDESLTWQQYFLDQAFDYWQMYQSLANAALAEDMEMDAEDQATLEALPQDLEETAQSYEMTLEELLAHNIGPGASVADYASYQELYFTGKPYYLAKTEAMVPTQEELEAFFAENEDYYAENGITKDSKYVDVRHILLTVEGGTTDENGNTTYSDEEWEDCRVKAQAVLDTWLDGEHTEDSFAALANAHSQDPGSNTTGGLYEDVYEGQMVEAFNDWCFDATRAYGDYGLVQTNYGYHVMYFVGSSPIWEEQAKTDWVTQQTNQLIEDLAAANPMTIDYTAISLGYIDMAA